MDENDKRRWLGMRRMLPKERKWVTKTGNRKIDDGQTIARERGKRKRKDNADERTGERDRAKRMRAVHGRPRHKLDLPQGFVFVIVSVQIVQSI